MNTMMHSENRLNMDMERGFTLIEVLVAIMFLTIGLLSLNAMQVSSINGNADAIRLTTATNWASDQVETLLNLPYSNSLLSSGTHDPENDGVDNDGDGATDEDDEDGVEGYQISWVVTNNPGGVPNIKQITVTVTKNMRGATRTVTLNTIKPAIY